MLFDCLFHLPPPKKKAKAKAKKIPNNPETLPPPQLPSTPLPRTEQEHIVFHSFSPTPLPPNFLPPTKAHVCVVCRSANIFRLREARTSLLQLSVRLRSIAQQRRPLSLSLSLSISLPHPLPHDTLQSSTTKKGPRIEDNDNVARTHTHTTPPFSFFPSPALGSSPRALLEKCPTTHSTPLPPLSLPVPFPLPLTPQARVFAPFRLFYCY